MKIEFIQNLKHRFFHIAPFWEEWKHHESNGLTEVDVELLNTFHLDDFTIKGENFKTFLEHLHIMNDLIKKLERSFFDFKNWLITKFLSEVFIITYSDPPMVEFTMPLSVLQSMKDFNGHLSSTLANTLGKFGCSSIQEIVDAHSVEDYHKPEKFSIIHEYLIQLQFERQMLQAKTKNQ
jgi:hypothetical protein